MSRLSSDELAADGTVFNGFDYKLQVWVHDGFILDCNHVSSMHTRIGKTCNGHLYVGRPVRDILGHEVREI